MRVNIQYYLNSVRAYWGMNKTEAIAYIKSASIGTLEAIKKSFESGVLYRE